MTHDVYCFEHLCGRCLVKLVCLVQCMDESRKVKGLEVAKLQKPIDVTCSG